MSQRFERNETVKRGHRALRVIYDGIDRAMEGAERVGVEMGTPLSCKKGCHACCSILPMVVVGEAIYAVSYAMAKHADKLDAIYQAARKQTEYLLHRDATSADWFDRKTRCVFLSDEGTCNVYEARPLNCRIYAVKSPPELCSGGATDLVAVLDTRELRHLAWQRFPDLGAAYDVASIYAPLPLAVLMAFDYLATSPATFQEHVEGTLFANDAGNALFWTRLEKDLKNPNGWTYDDYTEEGLRRCGVCQAASGIDEWNELRCPRCGLDHEAHIRRMREVEVATFGPLGIAGLFDADGRFTGYRVNAD